MFESALSKRFPLIYGALSFRKIMNVELANSLYPNHPDSSQRNYQPEDSDQFGSLAVMDSDTLANILLHELQAEFPQSSPLSGTSTTRSPKISLASATAIVTRIALEVQRICQKSQRIQNSGQVDSWQLALGRHRLKKCLTYYRLSSTKGRVELHSNLSVMVYRHIAPLRAQLGFQARYTLIEDFLQSFYIESLKAFRRENQLGDDYMPRTKLELAEYMAFTEHYAKRRISLPGGYNQQLIILRAQGFANGQPAETAIDIELAVESPKGEDSEAHSRSYVMQQVRKQLVAEAHDPADGVLRERVLAELVQYLEAQGQADCVDYLTLKLQDLPAQEIDELLNLSPRQRDYLQQRFKYHVEKFARVHHWQLVHQWLGADLDQNLGMSRPEWDAFLQQLSLEQVQLFQMKQAGASDQAIAKTLKCTPKQVQKRWSRLLELAWQARNTDEKK